MTESMIGYCGVDCASCPDLVSGHCPGCRRTEWADGEVCLPVRCCREQGISYCGECEQFPCSEMGEFYRESFQHHRAYQLMNSMKKVR